MFLEGGRPYRVLPFDEFSAGYPKKDEKFKSPFFLEIFSIQLFTRVFLFQAEDS